ncbi:DUF3558 domain-containing protein [Actinokineospora sp. G85]|uniref:DUF3558 domain-containing protein n=1 Tax=Actinokineospora sp. G85 TaxID=3406626 RepID=UPI003C7878BD
MKRAVVGVAFAALLPLGVVACSERTPGRAVADQGATVTGEPTSSSRSTGPSPDSDDPLTSLDPCELPTPSMKTTLGLTKQPEFEDFKFATSCKWQVGEGAIANRYTLGFAIFPKSGLDKVVAFGEKKEVAVNSRRGVQSLGAGGSVCAVSIEVTATSRVDVAATGAGSNDGSLLCPKVLAAAELIEPELPK